MDIRQVLSLAVQKEQGACELYERAAVAAVDPAAKRLFLDMAAEEEGHRAMLLALDPADLSSFEPEDRQSPGIAEHLARKPLAPGAGLQDLLAYAIHREQEAELFYKKMAEGLTRPELKELFGKLAAMEASHKVHLEELYDDMFLREG